MANGGRPTIKDVAAKAQVSLGTASRVLNGHSSVALELRRQVERAIIDLGYSPDAVAQSMRFGVTRTVGIILRDLTIPALSSFINGAQGRFDSAGYTLMLASSENRTDRETRCLAAFARHRVGGIILSPAPDEGVRQRSPAGHGIAPVVLLDRVSELGLDQVLIDHRGGVRRAVDYLLSMGHRRIALVTGPERLWPGGERKAGYLETFAGRGFSPNPDLVSMQGFGPEVGHAEATRLLALRDRPTALLVGGIAMLPGVLRAIRMASLRIPDDISLIASCDSELAQLSTPSVSVIRWNYAEVGQAAADLVLSRVQLGPEHPGRQVLFETELLLRDSCAPPRRES